MASWRTSWCYSGICYCDLLCSSYMYMCTHKRLYCLWGHVPNQLLLESSATKGIILDHNIIWSCGCKVVHFTCWPIMLAELAYTAHLLCSAFIYLHQTSRVWWFLGYFLHPIPSFLLKLQTVRYYSPQLVDYYTHVQHYSSMTTATICTCSKIILATCAHYKVHVFRQPIIYAPEWCSVVRIYSCCNIFQLLLTVDIGRFLHTQRYREVL